ncbi:MAG: hypothetical protein JXP73_20665, partial [Deltaproteobacteria bacterium]|nr:hypothetical protein [Deltaproteobacteria bacterium]
MSRQSSLVLSLVAGLVGSLAIGCSPSSRSTGSGGSQAQGGSQSQGGSPAAGGGGGSKSPGAGGTTTGGAGAGGTGAGGARSGGTGAGGTSTGGTGAGGTRSGGTGAGGTSTGGTGAGGTRAGGSGAGGTGAGGTGAGGTSAGGSGAGGTGSGGTGAGGTGAGGSTAVGECTNAGTVSNFDDGTMAVRDVAKSGLTGALWDAYHDATSGTIKLAVEDGGSGTCGPKALHITGSGFTDWGAGAEFILGGTFAPGKSQAKPVDVSAYVGIQFKAKIGANHKNPVRIQISTPATEDKKESSGACDPA